MKTSVDKVKSRSVSPNTRANFIPIVAFKWHNAMREQPYLDFLSAKYLDSLKEITEYSLYTINNAAAYRPDYISFLSYGTTDYWWLICFYNKIIHPMRDLYPSRVLKIPSVGQVTKMFQQMQEKNTNIGRYITL
jgi:hypothetical protein